MTRRWTRQARQCPQRSLLEAGIQHPTMVDAALQLPTMVDAKGRIDEDAISRDALPTEGWSADHDVRESGATAEQHRDRAVESRTTHAALASAEHAAGGVSEPMAAKSHVGDRPTSDRVTEMIATASRHIAPEAQAAVSCASSNAAFP